MIRNLFTIDDLPTALIDRGTFTILDPPDSLEYYTVRVTRSLQVLNTVNNTEQYNQILSILISCLVQANLNQITTFYGLQPATISNVDFSTALPILPPNLATIGTSD